MTSASLYGLLAVALLAQPIAYNPDERPDLIAFGFDGFDPGIDRHIDASDTREKLLQRFGQPRKLEMRKEPHRRDPTVLYVEVYTWQYDGLEIITTRPVLYAGYEKPNQWIDKITLTNPDYQLKFGLRIGSPREAFIEKFGQPGKETASSITYWATYYGTDGRVTFRSHPRIYIEFDDKNGQKKSSGSMAGINRSDFRVLVVGGSAYAR